PTPSSTPPARSSAPASPGPTSWTSAFCSSRDRPCHDGFSFPRTSREVVTISCIGPEKKGWRRQNVSLATPFVSCHCDNLSAKLLALAQCLLYTYPTALKIAWRSDGAGTESIGRKPGCGMGPGPVGPGSAEPGTCPSALPTPLPTRQGPSRGRAEN